ncbi:MAG: LptF/LptG family permease [Marinifilaceae bacterium]
MKKLHIFMLKSYLGPFVATFFISMFVLIMQFLWRMIDDIVGKGLDFEIIAELMWYVSITLVPMALPLAVLLSSIMTFGTLGENYELVALKAAGISLYRIMQPLIIFIVLLTGFAFFFSNNVMPYANLKMISLLYDIRKQKPEMSFKEGIFTNDLEGYSVKVDKINKKSGMMYGMLIYNHTSATGNSEVTIADSGTMQTIPNSNLMELTLYNGHSYTDEGMQDPKVRKTFPFRRLAFEKQVLLIELPGTDLKRTDESLWSSNSKMLSIKELNHSVDSLGSLIASRKRQDAERLLSANYLKNKSYSNERDSVLRIEKQGVLMNVDSLTMTLDAEDHEDIARKAVGFARDVKQRIDDDMNFFMSKEENVRRYDIEWHRKFTLSFACFIFFFIGAPLGAIIRKGGLGMPVVISVFLFIVYYIISMMGERATKESVITPAFGMWLSAFVLFPLGVVLTYKAVTDSSMMNSESYAKFIEKITNYFKNKKNGNK